MRLTSLTEWVNTDYMDDQPNMRVNNTLFERESVHILGDSRNILSGIYGVISTASEEDVYNAHTSKINITL